MTSARQLVTTQPSSTSVRLEGRELVIADLRVSDPDVLAAAHRAADSGTPLHAWLPSVLRTGAVALSAAASGRDLEALEAGVQRASQVLQQAVEQSSRRLTQTIDEAVDPNNGRLATATREQIDRLADGVTKLVTGRDAVLPASVRSSVSELTTQVLAEITRALAGTTTSVQRTVQDDRQHLLRSLQDVLASQHTQVTSQIGDLRAQLAAVGTNRTRTSAVRGAVWETQVVDQISRIAHGAGDGGADATGSITGKDGAKTGDAVVDFRAQHGTGTIGRLVIEAKDVSTPLSLATITKEARGGCSNRGADVALLVCPRAELLPGRQSLLVLDARTIAVAWEPGLNDEILQCAYLMLKVVCARDLAAPGQAVNAADLHRHTKAALDHLTLFDTLDRHTGTAAKNLEALREQTTKLRHLLGSELEAISIALTSA